MIKLQDARIADGLPRVVAEQPWAKVLSAVYGELQGRMLEYLATGMTFSDVDNCSEGMLDQMAIYLKIEWYDSAADIETKRKLVRTAIEIQRYAGTVKAVREQVETIYKKARIEEWFSYGGTPGFWKLYVDITDDQETYHTAAEMEKLLGYVGTRTCRKTPGRSGTETADRTGCRPESRPLPGTVNARRATALHKGCGLFV